ncbi:hypothetical protein HC864_03535 [Candidatus Gracilibacteria bacterium]|nr:hypothetical protein [Candidatus Gracilibacteria bacterium]
MKKLTEKDLHDCYAQEIDVWFLRLSIRPFPKSNPYATQGKFVLATPIGLSIKCHPPPF